MKRYFITGTDTNCGKTYVTCQLLKFFHGQNKRVMAIKPVATGHEDLELLNYYNGQFAQPNICPWQFAPPIAPHLAAMQAGVELKAQAIAEFCYEPRFSDLDILLVEGAGGLMVPFNTQETWIDFLQYSKMPVILVVGMRLGCINHALLTYSALNNHAISCAGWIANCIDSDMLALEENIATLKTQFMVPLISKLTYGSELGLYPMIASSCF